MKQNVLYQGMNTIDVLKLFFSFCIVGIHTDLLCNLPENVQWMIMHLFFRVGVPFFMVTSGFFLGLKLNKNVENRNEIFRNYRQRLIPPLVMWGGIGTVFYIIELVRNGNDIIGILLRCIRTIVFYPRGAMWFVAACIVSSLILQIVIDKRLSEKKIFVSAIILYMFALCSNTYYFLLENSFFGSIVDLYLKICISARNGVFLFIFFLSGYVISLPKVKKWLEENSFKAQIIFVTSIILFVLEVCFTYGKSTRDDNSLFISFIIFIPLLVHFASRYNLKTELPYKGMRSLSTVIYYVHSVVIGILDNILEIRAEIKFIIVILCCIVVYMFSRRSKKEFVKKMF